MERLITAIMATICLLTLGTYDFLCLCRIIKKEKWVENIWRYILPDRNYDEMKVFMAVRPMLLTISLLAYIMSGGALAQLFWFRVILSLTPIFAVGCTIANINKK